MEYFRYKYRCTLHTEVTLLVGVGHSNIYWCGCALAHKGGGGGLRCGHNPKKGVLGTCTVKKVGSYVTNWGKTGLGLGERPDSETGSTDDGLLVHTITDTIR